MLWVVASGLRVPILHIPARARFSAKRPPKLVLARATADGADQPLSAALELDAETESVELVFRALTYRSPASVRYRVRTSPDGPWSAPQPTATFQFLDPPAGDHYVEVSASLDGVSWQTATARVRFFVLRPWYARWWAWLTYVALAMALLYAAHRARVAVLLELERQRQSLARDLHDEIGSGVGSIGILAGVMNSETISEAERSEMTERIQDTALELGASLGDIVWSLRTESDWLSALPDFLRSRGAALFAGNSTELRAKFADLPSGVRIDVRVRRNVQLIALEAMHNAAKHADAQIVEVGLEPSGDHYRLWIHDDGRGFNPAAEASGLGLSSMEARADEISGTLSLETEPEQGTRIELSFRPI